MSEIMDVERLRQRCAAGESFKYLYFWGHRPATDDKVGKSCFSQWYEASFKLDGVRYASAEHYMMAAKARLFDDPRLLERILAALRRRPRSRPSSTCWTKPRLRRTSPLWK